MFFSDAVRVEFGILAPVDSILKYSNNMNTSALINVNCADQKAEVNNNICGSFYSVSVSKHQIEGGQR